jgi:hypothetical protein
LVSLSVIVIAAFADLQNSDDLAARLVVVDRHQCVPYGLDRDVGATVVRTRHR